MEQSKKSKGGKSGKKSSKQCDNPNQNSNKGKPNQKSARQLQEELNKRLEEMRKGSESEMQKNGQPAVSGMSEQFARAAAQQEAIRRMLQKAADELKKSGGKEAGELNNLINEMEKTERDLVNKIINPETMRRQQNILTRLMDSENAQLQREQEERRESKEAKQIDYKLEEFIKEYNKHYQNEKEIILKYQPVLTPYYKQKVDNYFD